VKTIYNSRQNRIEIKDGRKVYASFATTGLTTAQIDGILAGLEGQDPTEQMVEDAIAAALAKRGSVIPDHYRHQYGVEQSCGDDVAKTLTALVTDPKTGVDLEACRTVAAANEVEDRFDVWMAKDLNPGMVRMNLGNVLRGRFRRGEVVVIGDARFNTVEAD